MGNRNQLVQENIHCCFHGKERLSCLWGSDHCDIWYSTLVCHMWTGRYLRKNFLRVTCPESSTFTKYWSNCLTSIRQMLKCMKTFSKINIYLRLKYVFYLNWDVLKWISKKTKCGHMEAFIENMYKIVWQKMLINYNLPLRISNQPTHCPQAWFFGGRICESGVWKRCVASTPRGLRELTFNSWKKIINLIT